MPFALCIPLNVNYNQDIDSRTVSYMKSTSEWKCAIFLLYLWRRAPCHAVSPLSNMSTVAPLIERCGHCALSPWEAQKPANLEDPNIRSASNQNLLACTGTMPTNTNTRTAIQCQGPNIVWKCKENSKQRFLLRLFLSLGVCIRFLTPQGSGCQQWHIDKASLIFPHGELKKA